MTFEHSNRRSDGMLARFSVWPAVFSLTASIAWAGGSASPAAFGSKHVTVHQVKNVVGPTVQIDEAGIVFAAWVEEDKDIRTIWFARSEEPGGPLASPVRINDPSENPYYRQEAPALVIRGNAVFVTWALTHPKMTPDKPFSSELRLSRSDDGGRTFAPSILVNDDGQVINHTFDAMQVAPDGAVHVAWIDGREGKKEPGTFVAKSADHGRTFTKNLKVDDNTCVCCRTALATSGDGVVYLAWRKIFEDQVREIVVSRSTDGGNTFSAPVIVGHDRWMYPACPHRPASLGVDRRGRLYVVWYTEGADETPSIYLAYSDDQGRTFSPKQQLNRSKGTFPDHPHMAVDSEGRVVVVWEEQSPVRREVVVSRSLDRGESFSAPVKVNEKNGQTPTVAVNAVGSAVIGWKEHAMPAHRLVVQTMQLAPVETTIGKAESAHGP